MIRRLAPLGLLAFGLAGCSETTPPPVAAPTSAPAPASPGPGAKGTAPEAPASPAQKQVN